MYNTNTKSEIMKANKVLEKLEITRRTLNNYVKCGKIRVEKLENGFYEYDEGDVLSLEKNIVVHNNRIIVFYNNNKYEFNLSSDKIQNVLKMIENI